MRNRREPGFLSAAFGPTTSKITMELLGRGTHANPHRGGNVLELASILAGERWGSHPRSVHPALAAVARTVNDLLADDRRRLLTPLAPWLLGTDTAGACAWPALADVCVRAAPASISWLNRPGLPLALSWAGRANRGDADALCKLLVDCINECRRLADEQAVDPRLPLADCPERLVILQRFMWSPGCDWMEIVYQPLPDLLPPCLRRETAGAR
jgi:hypothetical protein